MSTAKKRYHTCIQEAKARGIAWELTYEQWNNWWLMHGVDREVALPNTKDALCMCRIGDVGPYSLDNIYCATRSQNSIDRTINKPTKTKPVLTPYGKFNSIVEAAQTIPLAPTTLGGKKNYIRHHCQNKTKGYQFV